MSEGRLAKVGIAALLSICALAVNSQQADKINHSSDGTSVTTFHEAFQKQPAHLFSFHYLKSGSVEARGSWKNIGTRPGDQVSAATNIYLICTKSDMTCIESSAKQEGAYPRADINFYPITNWTTKSLEAVNDQPICVKNIITIEFETARVVVTNVLKQDSAETIKTCAQFGIDATTTYQLW